MACFWPEPLPPLPFALASPPFLQPVWITHIVSASAALTIILFITLRVFIIGFIRGRHQGLLRLNREGVRKAHGKFVHRRRLCRPGSLALWRDRLRSNRG